MIHVMQCAEDLDGGFDMELNRDEVEYIIDLLETDIFKRSDAIKKVMERPFEYIDDVLELKEKNAFVYKIIAKLQNTKMQFTDFIQANKAIAIVLTIKEYESIRPLLQKHYTIRQIEHIDDYCAYKSTNEKFLLCNPHKAKQIHTPMMYLNAVTFIDRIGFENIDFE